MFDCDTTAMTDGEARNFTMMAIIARNAIKYPESDWNGPVWRARFISRWQTMLYWAEA